MVSVELFDRLSQIAKESDYVLLNVQDKYILLLFVDFSYIFHRTALVYGSLAHISADRNALLSPVRLNQFSRSKLICVGLNSNSIQLM